jgi:hypothetical protein
MQAFTGSFASLSLFPPPTIQIGEDEHASSPSNLARSHFAFDSMKLHKLQPASSDLSAQTAHLADKYMGRFSNYGSQIAFGLDRNQGGRRGGKYPPSRDGEFTTMMENEQFNTELAKGGHGVPLTSAFSSFVSFGKVAGTSPLFD